MIIHPRSLKQTSSLSDKAVWLEVESRTILVENSWIRTNGGFGLNLVRPSADVMLMRGSKWTLFCELFLLIVFWLLLLRISSKLVIAPPGVSPVWNFKMERQRFIVTSLGGLLALAATGLAL